MVSKTRNLKREDCADSATRSAEVFLYRLCGCEWMGLPLRVFMHAVPNWVMRTTGGAEDKHAHFSRNVEGWERGGRGLCPRHSALDFGDLVQRKSHTEDRLRKQDSVIWSKNAATRLIQAFGQLCNSTCVSCQIVNFFLTRRRSSHRFFLQSPADQSAAARMQDHGGDRQVASRWASRYLQQMHPAVSESRSLSAGKKERGRLRREIVRMFILRS